MMERTSPSRNLLAAADLEATEIHLLFSAARAFAAPVRAGETVPLLTGRTVATVFFENSTRTRLSFEQAARRLGAGTLGFAAAGSSAAKGETLIDTARNLVALQAHGLVLRHSASGSPHLLSRAVDVPVVNAGDGFHEHPTQALLDAFTLVERLGDLRGKRVTIVGDIAHSRVARSNLHVLRKLGAQVTLCGPPTLLPVGLEAMGARVTSRIDEALEGADAVMALRIQLERQHGGQHGRVALPSLGEYAAHWSLSRARVDRLKPEAIVLHPGPMNRGVEIAPEVADGPRSVVLDQVFHGVLVRMAVLARLMAPVKLDEWLANRGSGPKGKQ